MAYGLWPMAHDLWPMAHDLWPMAYGLWPMACANQVSCGEASRRGAGTWLPPRAWCCHAAELRLVVAQVGYSAPCTCFHVIFFLRLYRVSHYAALRSWVNVSDSPPHAPCPIHHATMPHGFFVWGCRTGMGLIGDCAGSSMRCVFHLSNGRCM